MNSLSYSKPYGPRDAAAFLTEMNRLTAHHRSGCPEFARIWPGTESVDTVEALPWLHVGLFKRLSLKTQQEGAKAGRTLASSSTSGVASLIHTDSISAKLQAASSLSILKDFVGQALEPLIVLDSTRSLIQRGMSARIAAALSLKPLATDLHFLLNDAQDPGSHLWDELRQALEGRDAIRVYGFTWMLWQAWAEAGIPEDLVLILSKTRVVFVHSGGWKKLEAEKVSREDFDARLLATVAAGSKVVDYYGLVEQVGVVYPLCEHGARHVPVWAEVLVRDVLSGKVVPEGEAGLLQLMNTLAWGAPYHNVLTEDTGRILPGPCPCGRSGKRFQLIGRLPKAEVRGCANV